MLIFTYAPAGLGHLRVIDALVDSRPHNHPYIVLGSHDRFITSAHRFLSTNFLAKWIFTISQYGLLEDFVIAIYRWFLVSTSEKLFLQLRDTILEKKETDDVFVIATHFGMAHQIGAIKDHLIKETERNIRLIVQVTDDTSQHIWCIKGSDLTFVPSMDTKKELEVYAKSKNMSIKFEVAPYPLSPTLTGKIAGSNNRNKALTSHDEVINVAVPISGAVVGLTYVTKLISEVQKKSSRFRFWVIVKKSIYTDMFLMAISKLPNVNLVTGRNDNEMIGLYELLYQDNLIHLEITKPSEQAFKAILPPNLVGGSVLLFSSPVGRQEYENIDFLVRHGLMPRSNYGGSKELDSSTISTPRAIRLSKNPDIAANFIIWGLDSGYFAKMSSTSFKFSDQAVDSGEVGPDGAVKFWKIVQEYFG